MTYSHRAVLHTLLVRESTCSRLSYHTLLSLSLTLPPPLSPSLSLSPSLPPPLSPSFSPPSLKGAYAFATNNDERSVAQFQTALQVHVSLYVDHT